MVCDTSLQRAISDLPRRTGITLADTFSPAKATRPQFDAAGRDANFLSCLSIGALGTQTIVLFEGEAMWAVDFQASCRGRPANDLAYFVTGSVQRDVDEYAVLDAYCDELAARGVKGYDRATCGRDYTLSKLFQLYLYVGGESRLDVGKERGVRLREAMRERLFSRLPPPPYDGLLDP